MPAIMVDARNVSILSSDIMGHNRIGSDRQVDERAPHQPIAPADAHGKRSEHAKASKVGSYAGNG